MADYFLPGDFLRNSRGLTLSDAGGVSWAWDPATNTLTASATTGLDADLLDGFDSTEFALLAEDEVITGAWTFDNEVTFNENVDFLGDHVHIGVEDIMVVNGATIHGQFEMNSDTAAIQEIHTHSAGNNSVLYFARARGTTALPTVVSADDYLGAFYAVGYDGTDYALSAGIQFAVDGTPGNNDMPGRIIFLVSPDGSHAPVEALRITSAKHVDMRNDSAELRLGASQDLRLYHDGTNSLIENDTGALILDSVGTTIFKESGTTLATFDLSGVNRTLTLGDGTNAVILDIDGAAANARVIRFKTGGVARFDTRINITAESGANAGSNYDINRYDDTGVNIGTLLRGIRSSGQLQLGGTATDVSAPVLALGADPNTGLYWPAGDTLGLVAGGVEALRLAATSARFPIDSFEVRLGVGDDLRLYHDGTNSYIENNTGQFILKPALNLIISDTSTAGASLGTPTKFVSLVHNVDNSKLTYEIYIPEGTNNRRAAFFLDDATGTFGFDCSATSLVANFEIQRVGAAVFRISTLSATLPHVDLLLDNQQLRIGAGQDLTFYHDGTNSYIDNNTGNLILRATGDFVFEEGAFYAPDGTVSVPQYSFTSDTDLGMYRVAANVLGLAASSGVQLENALPAFWLVETDQAADGTTWRFASSGGTLGMHAFNDAKSTARQALGFTRSGNAVTNVNFGNVTDNPAYSFLGTGTTAFGGVLNVTGNININNDTGLLRLGASADLTLTHDGTNSIIANATGQLQFKDGANVAAAIDNGAFAVTDGITAPTAIVGLAFIYVDTADGDLKVRFGDGTTKTIVTDT
jgi:hypothetical protein